MKVLAILAGVLLIVGVGQAHHRLTRAEAHRLCGPIDKRVCAVCRCGWSAGDIAEVPDRAK